MNRHSSLVDQPVGGHTWPVPDQEPLEYFLCKNPGGVHPHNFTQGGGELTATPSETPYANQWTSNLHNALRHSLLNKMAQSLNVHLWLSRTFPLLRKIWHVVSSINSNMFSTHWEHGVKQVQVFKTLLRENSKYQMVLLTILSPASQHIKP